MQDTCHSDKLGGKVSDITMANKKSYECEPPDTNNGDNLDGNLDHETNSAAVPEKGVLPKETDLDKPDVSEPPVDVFGDYLLLEK